MTGTSTTRPTGTSSSRAATAQLAPSVVKVLAALHRLGEDTAAGTAAEAGLGYSTTTPKLRTLEDQGLAEHIRGGDGRTLWRVTDKGRAYVEREQAGAAEPDGTQSSTAERADTEASDTAAAQDRRQPDGASEPFDEAAPQAAAPDEAATGQAEPPDPATVHAPTTAADPATADGDDPRPCAADHSAGDGSGAQSAADAETAAGAVAETPESDGPAADAGNNAADAAAAAPAEPAAPAGGRRASGTLRGAILDILEASPDQRYKTSELCRLIDQANEGTGATKASAGAVVNAANKLVQTGRAVLAVEKPATFALAVTDANSTAS